MTKSAEELAEAVKAFWGWEALDFRVSSNANTSPASPRRSTAYNQYNASYAITWYQMARKKSRRIGRASLSEESARIALRTAEPTPRSGEHPRLPPRTRAGGCEILAAAPPEKTYLDGAAFFSGDNRWWYKHACYNRLPDHFWFTIAHEIAQSFCT
ncbi:MAG: hypothetical protein IPG32_01125 [Saprospirales bacterium]|nr:hypothetical protein [Saprospirales bacterium]